MKREIIYTKGQQIGNCIYLNDESWQYKGLKRRRCAKFRCVCGNDFIATISNVKKRNTLSCGCISIINTKKANTKHGLTETTEYRTWCHMKGRCYAPNDKKYKDYGARGIIVCDRWLNSFENFLADVGKKPTPQHSIDRIDVNGNYEVGNVKWSTPKEQGRNKRKTVMITFQGETKTANEWSEILSINAETIKRRHYKGRPINELRFSKS